MSVSLVSITHPVDPSAEVPFIGGRCPLSKVAVETWKVAHIKAMGFGVEVHAEPYDPVAESNAAAEQLAAQLAGAVVEQPVAAEEPAQPVAEAEVAPPAVEQPVVPPQDEEATGEEATGEEATGEEATGEEEVGMTEEELAALRVRVEALATKADAEALIAEYGIQLDPMPSKLKDIKAQLIAMIDAPAE